MKTYVLTVSRNFPATHSMKGQPTDFFAKILSKEKKHTIRANYPLWRKRIDEVNQGIAILSVRQWSSKPYCSPQQEIMQFGKGQIGVQKLGIDFLLGYIVDDVRSVTTSMLAENDGLLASEFIEWFKKVKPEDDLAIIHFTDFRY